MIVGSQWQQQPQPQPQPQRARAFGLYDQDQDPEYSDYNPDLAMAHHHSVGATFVPGGMNDYYMPPTGPELVAPAPQRLMPEMSHHIQEGIANMQLDAVTLQEDHAFPRVAQRGRHIPQTYPDFEATLENARVAVLNSNDPDMQLAWAQDALQYVTICLENEERLQQTQPPRPQQPPVERQIMTDATNIVAFLADQHHPKAEFMRGVWFEFGRFGVTLDRREAFRCYARAADRGYARAYYRLGMLYENANDEQKALKNYHRGVKAQDTASLYRLGMITLRGQYGQPRDFAQGIDFIKRSADSIDENAPQGAYVYGMLLARQLPQVKLPEGTLPFDEQEARRYIENAAFCRFSKAQLKMASAYELASLGCEFDPALSLHYNRLAAKQGEPEADMAISKWFLVGNEPLFPKNEELSYMYAQRAAFAGLSTAEFALGYFSELGIHVPKNLDLAMQWYKKAAENGNADAQGRIDGISRRQVLSKRDHENVALNRIKSQHGSQRGKRPARLQARSPRVEPIAEDQAPPHPRRLSSLGPPASGSSSPAPYPLDDRPPTIPPGPRSSSTAPYPLENAPPRPAPVGGFLDARPATSQSMGRPRAQSALSRPDSAASAPVGRPSPGPGMRSPPGVDPRGRPMNGYRTASGPGPRPAPPATELSRIPAQSSINTRLDIGFSAPIENRPPSSSSTPRPIAQSNSNPNFMRPPRVDSATPRPSSQSGSTKGGTPAPSSASSTPAPSSSSGTPGLPPKSAKQGPKTFDEMGVPKQKQETECIIM